MKKPPKVRLAKPSKRPWQIRYTDPETKREIRISTGTHDEDKAQQQADEVAAKLTLGIPAKAGQRESLGPNMPWEQFRDEYRRLHLHGDNLKDPGDPDGRLDVIERILKPRRLADVADATALATLQRELLAGKACKKDKRSPHTVRTYMNTVVAALNWAKSQKWIPDVPKIKRAKVSKQRKAKGRPLTRYEYLRMLAATHRVVGRPTLYSREDGTTGSYRFVLWGLWESALRLDELLHVSWDIPGTIRPVWMPGRLAVLDIPHEMQKNDTEEAIPLLPGFERLLLSVPVEDRTGWVFNPGSLQGKLGRSERHGRPNAEWVGKVISRIGKAARVVVNDKSGKFASAHDLRRTTLDRLVEAGVPDSLLARVARHASVTTTRQYYIAGDVQRDAAVLQEYLGTHRLVG